jgi:hypothetical protein
MIHLIPSLPKVYDIKIEKGIVTIKVAISVSNDIVHMIPNGSYGSLSWGTYSFRSKKTGKRLYRAFMSESFNVAMYSDMYAEHVTLLLLRVLKKNIKGIKTINNEKNSGSRIIASRIEQLCK